MSRISLFLERKEGFKAEENDIPSDITIVFLNSLEISIGRRNIKFEAVITTFFIIN